MDKPQALGEFVCLKWIKPEDAKTEGGIYMPSKKELRKGEMVKLQRGIVLNAGDQVEKLPAAVGDTVLYSEYDAQEYVEQNDVLEENVYHLVHMKYIKAIVDNSS